MVLLPGSGIVVGLESSFLSYRARLSLARLPVSFADASGLFPGGVHPRRGLTVLAPSAPIKSPRSRPTAPVAQWTAQRISKTRIGGKPLDFQGFFAFRV